MIQLPNKILHIVAGICLIISVAVSCWAENVIENEYLEIKKMSIAGQDPLGYSSAKDMYSTPPTVSDDKTTLELVKKIDHFFASSSSQSKKKIANFESDPIWSALHELNPSRDKELVQTKLLAWAKKFTEVIKGKPEKEGVKKIFQEANQAYKTGITMQATSLYLDILKSSPTHLGSRNNLALIKMKEGNDLMAQFELEVVRLLKPDYFPALINLCVLYERLGRRASAAKLAQEVMNLHKDVPQAVYNYAWYLNLEEKYSESDALLKSLLAEVGDTKYKELADLNLKKLGKPPLKELGKKEDNGNNDLFVRGLIKKTGWNVTGLKLVVSWIVFLLLALVLTFVINNYLFKPFVGFVTYLLAGAAFYLFAWGVPAEAWAQLVVIVGVFLYAFIALLNRDRL